MSEDVSKHLGPPFWEWLLTEDGHRRVLYPENDRMVPLDPYIRGRILKWLQITGVLPELAKVTHRITLGNICVWDGGKLEAI